jgi:outer membrane immunogenic protein
MTIKLIKAGAAAVALLAVPFAAVAADIRPPVYKGPPRSVIAFYDWTGLYAGLFVGYGSGESRWEALGIDSNPKGWLAGATVGYNWQAGSIVYGLEGDIAWTDVKGSSANVVCGIASTCETSNRWLATFRGRVGYAFDRFLPYVTAGGAYGDVRSSIVPAGVSASTTQWGWTAGGGIEYAVLSNWTAKFEYLYVDLGSFDPGFAAPVVGNINFKEHLVRVGLNYKFAGPSRW